MDLIGGLSGVHVLNGFWPVAGMYNTGSPNVTQAVNTGKYDQVTFILQEAAGGVGTCTITIEACTTAAGASPTAIAFRYRLCSTQDVWGAQVAVAASGYLTIAGANKLIAVEVDSTELTSGKPFVRMKMTVGDTTTLVAGVLIICSEADYPQNVPVTAIT